LRDENANQWNQGLQRPVCLAQNRTVKYGYARVSTEDQNASMQRTALKKFGCQKIFTDDGKSGATTDPSALEDVQYLAGHSSPMTTRVYDRRRKRVTRNIVERISI